MQFVQYLQAIGTDLFYFAHNIQASGNIIENNLIFHKIYAITLFLIFLMILIILVIFNLLAFMRNMVLITGQ